MMGMIGIEGVWQQMMGLSSCGEPVSNGQYNCSLNSQLECSPKSISRSTPKASLSYPGCGGWGTFIHWTPATRRHPPPLLS